MFLEIWMIAVLTVIWAAGMFHLHRTGWIEGMKEGTANATEMTLTLLQAQGLINIVTNSDGEDILTKSIPTDDEIRRMYHALDEKK